MSSDQRRQRIREAFLGAAEAILRSEGIDALTVRRVAERTGHSCATLYHSFTGMNPLLRELIMAGALMEGADWLPGRAPEPGTAADLAATLTAAVHGRLSMRLSGMAGQDDERPRAGVEGALRLLLGGRLREEGGES